MLLKCFDFIWFKFETSEKLHNFPNKLRRNKYKEFIDKMNSKNRTNVLKRLIWFILNGIIKLRGEHVRRVPMTGW